MGNSSKDVLRAYVRRNIHRDRGRSYLTLDRHTKNIIQGDRNRNGQTAPQSSTFSALHRRTQRRTSLNTRRTQRRTSRNTRRTQRRTSRN